MLSAGAVSITTDSAPRVAIIGAGIIGLSCAWELSKRGAKVTLFDSAFHPGRGASWAAAGMLAPAFEAAAEVGAHARLFDLCLESRAIWTNFAREIGTATGRDVLHFGGPSLAVALTAEDLSAQQTLAAAIQAKNISVDVLTPDEAVAHEPRVSRDNRGALLLHTDGQVDNRLLVETLIRALEKQENVAFVNHEAPLRQVGQALTVAGFDKVIIATGWQTPSVKVGDDCLGDIAPCLREIQPVGGHMLALVRQSEAPKMTMRCGALYIVPKAGRVVVGATVEPGATGSEIDWDTIHRLEVAAHALCPVLKRAPIIEAWRGVRPGTPDHAPMIGELAGTGALVASGHYRNGILLAPVTAKIVADMVFEEVVSELAAAFSPDRFAGVTS